MSNILDGHIKAYEGNNLYDFDNSILLNWYPKRIVDLRPKPGRCLSWGWGTATPLLFSRGPLSAM